MPQSPETVHERAPVKSADRATRVIEYVANMGTVSFVEVLQALGLPKSSGHALIQTLIASGWLEMSPRGHRYSLGLRAWEIGQNYSGHRLLAERATPVMRSLTIATGETVQLARLDGIENVYIAISPSPSPMRLASTVGMRLHAHATGIGKALLSTLSPDDAEFRLSQLALPKLTTHTIVDVPDLLRRIDRSRLLGFAVDDEEYIDGCRCVAVPVTDEGDTGIPSAISITQPTHRTDETWPHNLVPPLQAAAQEIRRQMGLAPERR